MPINELAKEHRIRLKNVKRFVRLLNANLDEMYDIQVLRAIRKAAKAGNYKLIKELANSED